MKCSEVAKEFCKLRAEQYLTEYWSMKFKSCEDFPRDPEVIKFKFENGIFERDYEYLRGRRWNIVATEIIGE
jgi:hypothetical protein